MKPFVSLSMIQQINTAAYAAERFDVEHTCYQCGSPAPVSREGNPLLTISDYPYCVQHMDDYLAQTNAGHVVDRSLIEV